LFCSSLITSQLINEFLVQTYAAEHDAPEDLCVITTQDWSQYHNEAQLPDSLTPVANLFQHVSSYGYQCWHRNLDASYFDTEATPRQRWSCMHITITTWNHVHLSTIDLRTAFSYADSWLASYNGTHNLCTLTSVKEEFARSSGTIL
jgi:hypothetical protein